MKLAIIGSRTCPPIEIEKYVESMPETIVSGGAKGADTYAREYARKNNLNLIEMLPDYKKYGRIAPVVRDKQIVEACDCLIAFWDGESRGTKYTVDYAQSKSKPIKIVNFMTNEISCSADWMVPK